MRKVVLMSVLGGCAALLAACGQGGDKAAAPEAPTAAAPETTTAPEASEAAEEASEKAEHEEKAKALAALPAPYNTADVDNGKAKFAMCRSCHTITEGGANLTGPNLHGVFGRKAGSLEGYNYSEAVKNAGFTWDAEHLDKWLAQPRDFLPGTKMTFAGFKAEKDRIDVIAYLKLETGYKAP
ncbi:MULTISPECIES: c-type cytochrome [Phenylobacterium]|uniref:Cytochrome c n=1 Tax=Phenylobacterium koreense TaxID=266125 RepID=A0ABV2ELF7_9CAUL